MSLTLAQRLAKVEAYAMVYHRGIKLSDQLMIKNIERSRDEVYRRFLNTQENTFRKPVSLADGAALPADFVIFANNAYWTSGTNFPAALIEVEEIPEVYVNPLVSAVSTGNKYACYYSADQKFNTIPAGLTMTVEYYAKPAALFTTPIDLTLTDNMPEDTEDAIARGAFERCLQVLLDEQTALPYTQAQIAAVSEAAANFYKDYFTVQTQGVQTQ